MQRALPGLRLYVVTRTLGPRRWPQAPSHRTFGEATRGRVRGPLRSVPGFLAAKYYCLEKIAMNLAADRRTGGGRMGATDTKRNKYPEWAKLC